LVENGCRFGSGARDPHLTRTAEFDREQVECIDQADLGDRAKEVVAALLN